MSPWDRTESETGRSRSGLSHGWSDWLAQRSGSRLTGGGTEQARMTSVGGRSEMSTQGRKSATDHAIVRYVDDDVAIFEYRFKVENFSSYEVKDMVPSPAFSTVGDIAWQLQVYPKGVSTGGKLALFLRCLSTKQLIKKYKQALSVSYRVMMFNQETDAVVAKDITHTMYQPDSEPGMQSQVDQANLEAYGWLKEDQAMVGVLISLPITVVRRQIERLYGAPPYHQFLVPKADVSQVHDDTIHYMHSHSVPRFSRYQFQYCMVTQPFKTGPHLRWHLKIYPKGSGSVGTDGYVSVFLSCDSLEKALAQQTRPPKVRFTVCLQAGKGGKVVEKKSTVHEFVMGQAVFGFPKLCLVEKLLMRNGAVDDSLELSVHLEIPKDYVPQFQKSVWLGNLHHTQQTLPLFLKDQYNQEEFADCTVTVPTGESFFAHKLVLSAHSPHLYSLFQSYNLPNLNGPTKSGGLAADSARDFAPPGGASAPPVTLTPPEGGSGLVNVAVPGVAYNALDSALKLMYGLQLQVEQRGMLELYKCVSALQCPHLVETVGSYIEARIKACIDDHQMFRTLLESGQPQLVTQCYAALLSTPGFYRQKAFLELSREQMAVLVERAGGVRSRGEVLYMVLCWVNAYPKARSELVEGLTEGMTLGEVEHEVAKAVVRQDWYVMYIEGGPGGEGEVVGEGVTGQ